MNYQLAEPTIKSRFLEQSGISLTTLFEDLTGQGYPAKATKEYLKRAADCFDELYCDGEDIRAIIGAKAWFMDQVLNALWSRYAFDQDNFSLIAVGGYGRGELQPHSDIDLLILAKDQIPTESESDLSSFITLLWDLSLEIGHSVRTIDECIEQASLDVTIATNLLETRTISGAESLKSTLTSRMYSDEVYTSKDYFMAKFKEQVERHERYGGNEYNLEPNIKASPGTLRDIQTVGWITKRHFGPEAKTARERYHFLTDEEFNLLLSGETFLWSLRYGLQMVANRSENRLLFDHQRKVAKILGYEDSDNSLGVELMMQRYYRTVLALAELADVILQYFDGFYLNPNRETVTTPLNNRFQVSNGYVETVDDGVFDRSPYALIEIFLLMAQNPAIKGIHATTIRLIREHQYLIDDSFRADLANTTMFREILRTPHRLHRTLRNMLKYNVLSRYLPEFASTVGQMQHDLFHTYTVDAHTIRLVRNIVRLHDEQHKESFPLAASLVKGLPKLELLYVAGIYHDIAKGRGGDHSELGAIDVRAFCQRHHFSERDTHLVSWLVEQHLLMSTTAQKKDVADPEIIYEFAAKIPSIVHLEYLYVLTVCDIAATNPKLWNTWRASLLQQLFVEARRALRKGVESPVSRGAWINATRQEVRSTLFQKEYLASHVNDLVDTLDDEFFLQGAVDDIVWQCEAILAQEDKAQPVIALRDKDDGTNQGFSQLMVYLRSDDDLFAAKTAMLEQLNINVLSARISSASGGFTVSNFAITNSNGDSLADDPERKSLIIEKLSEALDDPNDYPEIIGRRTPRALKHFSFPTEVTLSNDAVNHRTVVEVVTPDRPGLLARIGHILYQHDLSLVSARIATLGERVEDVFFITQENGFPLSDVEQCETLQHDICTQLDELASTES
ncbi:MULTISPECIES: [protein-PII] uridylyltransferase [unclassified Oleiphilus]|uniref:[protein-PII] uridylyltransferase n=4 Tax=Oleiphilus TaxID=141450 RepID=UPI0009EEF3C0|nr:MULTISPECIES: [protein-PII] uridylyltransferase [unclassified Oleiphilus]